MQLVMLAGELGEKYGTQHEYYNLHTPADAIKLLCINYPALKQELFRAHQNGVGYKVIQGGAAMGYDDLHLPFGSKPLCSDCWPQRFTGSGVHQQPKFRKQE